MRIWEIRQFSNSIGFDLNSNLQQHCEFYGCSEEVWAACYRCKILLCWHYFDVNLDCIKHKSTQQNSSCNEQFVLKPADFEVEGSPMEITRQRKQSKAQYFKENKFKKATGQPFVIPNSMNISPPKNA